MTPNHSVHVEADPVRAYVAELGKITGKTHHVITIPAGSPAYEMGYRYTTCPADELDNYMEHGATLVEDSAPPTTTSPRKRPPLTRFGEPVMHPRAATLYDWEFEGAKALGKGNFSLGVRKALKRAGVKPPVAVEAALDTTP